VSACLHNAAFHRRGGGVLPATHLTPRAHRKALDGIGLEEPGRPVLRPRRAALALRKTGIARHAGPINIPYLAGEPNALLARLAAWIKTNT
jgi:hypothetical protein